jgi:poly(A) polymerase
MTAPETGAVVAALTAEGAAVRFVGGCVRDAMAGRPVRDIDIATPEPPEVILRLLGAAGLRAIPTGIEHGTVTALSDGRHFEITTLRVDVETDGRRATVAFTDDWIADAARRDLTVNALSCAPDGELFDPFGGAADLAAGRIRFVGDAAQRIREDVLRLLRFFRFYAEFGRPPPDAEGLAACRASADLLPTLSGERVQAELFKLLATDGAPDVLALMAGEGVLVHVLGEASDFRRLRGLIAVEAAVAADSRPVRRLAALLDTGEDGIRALSDRLRLSGKDRDYLLDTCRLGAEFAPIGEPAVRRQWFYRHGADTYRELLLLYEAAEPATRTDLDAQLAAIAAWRRPAFPLTGDDVMALGVAAGPAVGDLLRRVETWWMDGDFSADRAACLVRLETSVAQGDEP